ncbi:FtsQ-type POTRA domain-containing protein [Nesterenkonia xinjiangensis]|uniref:Cell division protein FtsQ n=1 Tax=Nesterenkonia xinjiangensis TaxID=225327 RepID=A0A7Z0GNM3_9MICC|nr:cell division protein FtsQ [Nesterenkonia xinjiangensis]
MTPSSTPTEPDAEESREDLRAADPGGTDPSGDVPGSERPAAADPQLEEDGTVVALGAERPRRARIAAEEVFDDGGGPEEDPQWSSADSETAEPLPFPEPEVVGARRRRRRRFGWAAGVLGVLVAVVAVLYFSPLLTIQQVQVERNDLLTDGRAQELLQPLYGRPLPQVGNAQVQDLLAEEAVVEDVIVQGELPDTLTVEVVEHPPVAEVREGDGLLFYNEHGEVIRSFEDAGDDAAQGYATPRISHQAALQDEAVFRTIVSVLGELPPSAREAMDSATADSIDSVQLILDDGRTVLWGGEDLGEAKATVLEAILASSAEDFTEAEIIDISTPDTPVTR